MARLPEPAGAENVYSPDACWPGVSRALDPVRQVCVLTPSALATLLSAGRSAYVKELTLLPGVATHWKLTCAGLTGCAPATGSTGRTGPLFMMVTSMTTHWYAGLGELPAAPAPAGFGPG